MGSPEFVELNVLMFFFLLWETYKCERGVESDSGDCLYWRGLGLTNFFGWPFGQVRSD